MSRKVDKKKKKTRKVILSLAVLLLIGLICGTATYAWYTDNNVTYVKDVDVTITTSTGFQISADAENWQSFVETADLKAQAVNQFPAVSSPVSTVGDVESNGKMKLFKGVIVSKWNTDLHKDVYTLTATRSKETYGKADNASTDGDFVAFDLYLRSGNPGYIYLSESSKITLNNGTGQYASGIENAARVGFVVQGYTDYNSYKTTSLALSCYTDNPDGCFTSSIWEPNADTHNYRGVSNANKVYGLGNVTGKIVPYKGIKAAISKGVDVQDDDDTYFGDVTNLKSTPESGISSLNRVQAFKIQAGITKVRVYIWAEGQDVDCEDGAADSTLKVILGFSLVDSE